MWLILAIDFHGEDYAEEKLRTGRSQNCRIAYLAVKWMQRHNKRSFVVVNPQQINFLVVQSQSISCEEYWHLLVIVWAYTIQNVTAWAHATQSKDRVFSSSFWKRGAKFLGAFIQSSGRTWAQDTTQFYFTDSEQVQGSNRTRSRWTVSREHILR